MRPGEKHIEEAIAAAFERLPDPDPTRLKSLEERLSRAAFRARRRERPRWTYWWLILGFAATGAAAWWGGEYFSGESRKPAIEQHAPDVTGEPERAGTLEPGAERKRDSATLPGRAADSPTIYRRETY